MTGGFWRMVKGEMRLVSFGRIASHLQNAIAKSSEYRASQTVTNALSSSS